MDRLFCGLVGALVTLAISAGGASAQPLVVDQPVRAGGLWCLPSAEDPLRFRCLSDDARLARDASGKPLFSIVYYTEPRNQAAGHTSVDEAQGGALLTMILEYGTTPGKLALAERALQSSVDPDSKVDGPVVFQSGDYALVSATGERAERAFSSGLAPVVEGARIALSLRFDARGAQLLAQALKASTPDLSVVFDMAYAGVRKSYNADIVVDWDKAASSLDQGVSADVSVYGVGIGGEIEEAVTKMMSDGAITIDVIGEDASMDGIVTHVQEMATKLFFEPLDDVEAERSSGLDDTNASAAGANRYFSINARAKYKRKAITTSGVSRFSLSRQAPATRRWSIVFDAGEIARDLRDDPHHVRTEDLTDSTIKSRRIALQLDVGFRPIFEELVDLVTVEARKIHGDGRTSFDQYTITRDSLNDEALPTLSYPRFEGDGWKDWLSYETRSIWSFRDAERFETGWRQSRDDQITVSAPIRLAPIHPIGDMQALARRGVHAVIIKVKHPYVTGELTTMKSALTTEPLFPAFTVPTTIENEEFAYTVIHVRDNDRRDRFSAADRAGFVVFDLQSESGT